MKSVRNFFSNLNNRQTDRQTAKRQWKQYPFFTYLFFEFIYFAENKRTVKFQCTKRAGTARLKALIAASSATRIGSFLPLCEIGKGSPYSITVRRIPELIAVLGSQPASYVSHKPDGRLPLLSVRPTVTPLATLKRAAANFAAWWTEARCVWTVRLRLLPDSVAAAIWTQALLRLSPAR